MELSRNVITWRKKRGETPLEALNRLRIDRPELQSERLSYAGRLDPIAEGVLLVLVGDANNEREKYLGLDKEYVVDILWGISTDTGDILGVPHSPYTSHIKKDGLPKSVFFEGWVGKQAQKYPAYSSKTVNGVPLWKYAREGTLGEIQIPTHDVTIYNIADIQTYTQHTNKVHEYVSETIGRVKGDFRQDEIGESWREVLDGAPEEICFTQLRVTCSSGTYVRQLVADIGKKVNIPACVFRLERTRVSL